MNRATIKAITNVKALFPNDRRILDVLFCCDLQPTLDWRFWIDNVNYGIYLSQKKRITIRTHVPKQIKVTDLYYKASPAAISEISRGAVLAFGTSCGYCWFWGYDGRLRALMYDKNRWTNTMPLAIKNVSVLKTIVGHINTDAPLDPHMVKTPLPITAVYATRWPPSNAKIRKQWLEMIT